MRSPRSPCSTSRFTSSLLESCDDRRQRRDRRVLLVIQRRSVGTRTAMCDGPEVTCDLSHPEPELRSTRPREARHRLRTPAFANASVPAIGDTPGTGQWSGQMGHPHAWFCAAPGSRSMTPEQSVRVSRRGKGTASSRAVAGRLVRRGAF